MLLDFLREARIDRAGCFAYSPVAGAVANALSGHIPEEEKEQRHARFVAGGLDTQNQHDLPVLSGLIRQPEVSMFL